MVVYIIMQFLGCKELDSTESVTSDIELGGFLHNMGRRRLIWRKSKCAALAFVDKSFVITFNYHKQDKVSQTKSTIINIYIRYSDHAEGASV